MSIRVLPRARVLVAALAALTVLALSAPSARAAQVPVTGTNAVLLADWDTYTKMASDNIYSYADWPAELSTYPLPTVTFPIAGGSIDPFDMSGTIDLAGGLQMLKYNEDFSAVEGTVKTSNLRIRNFGNLHTLNAVTNDLVLRLPTADLTNPVRSDGPNGSIIFRADVRLQLQTALVLNVYFNTDVFESGMRLGGLTATITTGGS